MGVPVPVLRYFGIPADVADAVRETMKSPQYGHPAHRERAGGTGPCRSCLRTFEVGAEDRLLFTYQPFSDPESLPAPGPVFIHADTCQRYDALELPPDFRELPLVVEGYGPGGRLLIQERVVDEMPEVVLARAFAVPGVVHGHIRNGEAGCFMARVERHDAASGAPTPHAPRTLVVR
jgi:hypothetical protein